MPLVSHNLKLIYTHVPKTGGATIKTAIMKLDPKANMIGEYHSTITRDLIKQYPEYYKFTIVRNSYEVISSRYRFTYTYKDKHKVPPPGHPTFKEWLTNVNDAHIHYGHPEGAANQHWYYLDDEGEIVDLIIQYNKLQNGIDIVNDKIKENIIIPKKEKGGHYYGTYDWKEIYRNDPQTIDIVTELCQKDIEYFNWKFDDNV